MQRSTWTDERLDDLSRRMDSGFDRVDRDIRDLRVEVGGEFDSLRSDIRELRGLIYRFGAGLFAAIVVATFVQHAL
jgi:hypothetical protein